MLTAGFASLRLVKEGIKDVDILVANFSIQGQIATSISET